MPSNLSNRSHAFSLVAVTFVTAIVAITFHWFAFRGLGTDAMDIAQLARNLSAGHGFSTDFIRPYSLALIQGRSYHPDLIHAPLYPFILNWAITFFGARDGVVSAVSLSIFVLCAALLFQLVWRLSACRMISCGTVAIFVLCPIVLSAADSGNPLILSTFLLLAMLLALIPKKEIPNRTQDNALSIDSESIDTSAKEKVEKTGEIKESSAGITGISGNPLTDGTTDLTESHLLKKQLNRQFLIAGALAALCYLTDYISLIYVIPLAWVVGQEQQRWNRVTILKFLLGFVLLALPWWIRNLRLTGNPFYTLQWLDLITNGQSFAGSSLLRDFDRGTAGAVSSALDAFPRKLWMGLTTYFYEVPKIPHLYLMPFVVGAYWLPTRSQLTERLKTTLLVSGLLYVLILSALGRTNVIYLLPLVGLLAYLGVLTLQQIARQWGSNWQEKRAVTVLDTERRSPLWLKLSFASIATIFLLWPVAFYMSALPERTIRQDREAIGALSKALPENRIIVTDIPSAVAWYADRTAVWLPKDPTQLTQIEAIVPVSALYLSPALASTSVTEPGGWQQAYKQVSDIAGYDKVSRPQVRDILYVKQPTVAQAQAFVKAKSKDAQAYYGLGRAQLAAGQPGAALTAFIMAQRLRPQWSEPYWGAGSAHLRLKDKPAALRSLQQAEKLEPRSQKVLLGIAELYLASGQTRQAIETYERVLADSPNQPIAINNLAFLYSERNENIYRALELAKRAVMANQSNGQNWDTLGWVNYHAGRPKEAIEYLQRAVKLLPNNGVLQSHLAQVLMASGHKAEAIVAFKAAVELGLPAAEKQAAEKALKKR